MILPSVWVYTHLMKISAFKIRISISIRIRGFFPNLRGLLSKLSFLLPDFNQIRPNVIQYLMSHSAYLTRVNNVENIRKQLSKQCRVSTTELLRNLRFYFLGLIIMLDEISTMSKYKTVKIQLRIKQCL